VGQGPRPRRRPQGRGQPDQPAHPARQLAMAAPTATVPGRRHARRPGPRASRRRLRHYLTVLSFMAPALVGITVFLLYPLLSAMYFSFTKFSLLTTPQWVGLTNYK